MPHFQGIILPKMWINKNLKDPIAIYMPSNLAVLPFAKQKIICTKKAVQSFFKSIAFSQ